MLNLHRCHAKMCMVLGPPYVKMPPSDSRYPQLPARSQDGAPAMATERRKPLHYAGETQQSPLSPSPA